MEPAVELRLRAKPNHRRRPALQNQYTSALRKAAQARKSAEGEAATEAVPTGMHLPLAGASIMMR